MIILDKIAGRNNKIAQIGKTAFDVVVVIGPTAHIFKNLFDFSFDVVKVSDVAHV